MEELKYTSSELIYALNMMWNKACDYQEYTDKDIVNIRKVNYEAYKKALEYIESKLKERREKAK